MAPDESVLFKQFDFRPDAQAQGTFHHSFTDEHHGPASPSRRSVECRLLLVFDDEPAAIAKL